MANISPYIVIPIVTILVSQIIKFAIHAFSNEIDFKQLVKIGGSPSSLIAAIISLAVTSLAVDGINSSVAGVTIVLSTVVVVEFIANSKLTKLVQANMGEDDETKLLEYSQKDIALGGVVGFVSGVILSVQHWRDDVSWFFDRPSESEITFMFILFGALFVLGEVLSYFTRRKNMHKLPTSRKLNRAFRLTITAPAIIGIIITFAQKETLGVFDTRIWTYIIFDWIIIGTAWAWWSVYRHAKDHLAEERVHFKKTKEKEKSKKKKSKKSSKKKRK